MKNQEAYRKAKKKVQAKLGFKIHLAIYLVVNAILISVNVINSPDHLWFIWPLMGWSIGIFWHAMAIFVFDKRSVVIEKMIQKEMGKQF